MIDETEPDSYSRSQRQLRYTLERKGEARGRSQSHWWGVQRMILREEVSFHCCSSRNGHLCETKTASAWEWLMTDSYVHCHVCKGNFCKVQLISEHYDYWPESFANTSRAQEANSSPPTSGTVCPGDGEKVGQWSTETSFMKQSKPLKCFENNFMFSLHWTKCVFMCIIFMVRKKTFFP